VFIPSELLPDGLQLVGELLPIAHLFEALVTAFVGDDAPGIAVGHLAAVLAWGLGGLAVAIAGFRWSPRSRRS
jgi:ABC-2 type transport system permease protein